MDVWGFRVSRLGRVASVHFPCSATMLCADENQVWEDRVYQRNHGLLLVLQWS